MKHRWHAIAVLLVLLCGALPAHAGWQVFQPSDGILDSMVWDVTVAPNADVWFVTTNGVSRYDGLTWTNYTLQEISIGSVGLTNGRILAERGGAIWVAPSNQRAGDPTLVKFDGVRWEPVWTDKVKETNQMIEDSDGNIWFATDFGVTRFDGVNWVAQDNGQLYRHYCLLQDRQGARWFGTDHGVRRYQDGVWTDFTTADGHDLGQVRSIYQDRQGALWLGTRPIVRFDGENWTTHGTAEAPPWAGTFPSGWAGSPAGFAEDRSGNLWIAVPGSGVVRHRDGVWKIYRDNDDPRITYLENITLDPYENVWLATRLGAVRFDGEDWDYLRPGSEITSNTVNAILEERPGVCWIGTNRGLYRYENGSYTIYTTENGLLNNGVTSLAFAPDGSLWAGGFYGLSIFDGRTWTTRAVPGKVQCIRRHSSGEMYLGTIKVDGEGGSVIRIVGPEWTVYDTTDVPNTDILSIAEDDSSHVWVAAYGYGVGRFDGQEWQWYTPENGLATKNVLAVACGPGGEVWTATNGAGVDRFAAGHWTNYGVADGLPDNHILSILVDSRDLIWAGSVESATVSRFDGTFWRIFSAFDGLPGSMTRTFMEDHEGRIWIGSEWGVGILEQDRVAPKTFFHPPPAAITPSRRQILPLRAAYGETKGILFSHLLDGAPWSDWTAEATWVLPDLSDGQHDLQARARDSWGNMDPHPARVVIEVDATPPEPLIDLFTGRAARGEVSVTGTADDSRFGSYRLLVRPAGATTWEPPAATLLVESTTPVTNGELTRWNTRAFPDGDYELRLEVADTLGLVGVVPSHVVVDNEAPWVDETSPATVSAASGGDVYTTDGSMHLYFAPHAFPGDAVVTVAGLSASEVPDTLASGAVRIHCGCEIGWAGAEMKKPATFQLMLGAAAMPREGQTTGHRGPGSGLRPALYRWSAGLDWERIGGTIEDTSRISATINRPGRYAVFADAGLQAGNAGVSAITMTPRVFSPAGGFAGTEVSISFTLGGSGPATVRVYNRAGRLVKELASNRELSAGVNVLRWDGRDTDGVAVPDDMYLVSVEAGTARRVTTLAIVR